MTQTIEEHSRQRIATFLPDAIAKALTSYHVFSERAVDMEKPKEFSDHHSACKVAVAHIELLLKLARWADLPDKQDGAPNDRVMLGALLAEAEKELRDYKGIAAD
ncbi:MAG: hypothetical protein KJ667_09310 [Alphaproteobacteria bacterium]|nr:hypothetical protein [Alphaproteobacteria bacterium]